MELATLTKASDRSARRTKHSPPARGDEYVAVLPIERVSTCVEFGDELRRAPQRFFRIEAGFLFGHVERREKIPQPAERA